MYLSSASRPTWAEIALNNLTFNFRSSRDFIGKSLKYMAVVKADAYGHGAVECSRRLEAAGVDWFGVALPEEGVELRKAAITKRILCLGGYWPGQEKLILNFNLTPALFQMDRAELLDRTARERGTLASVHVKVDTGMGRVGVPAADVPEFAERLGSLRNIRVEGLMTHFASADDLESDFTSTQTRRFEEAAAAFREHGHKPVYLDLANSPGAVAHPDARGNMVRLGGILYGLGGDVLPNGSPKPELRPVLALRSQIALLKTVAAGESLGYSRTFTTSRESRIATIPIGYHDGYRRELSNKARVIVRGRFAPVVGRISMDWSIIDTTDIPDAVEGDAVTLIGADGDRCVTAEELAGLNRTISYEITCGISSRVERRFMA